MSRLFTTGLSDHVKTGLACSDCDFASPLLSRPRSSASGQSHLVWVNCSCCLLSALQLLLSATQAQVNCKDVYGNRGRVHVSRREQLMYGMYEIQTAAL